MEYKISKFFSRSASLTFILLLKSIELFSVVANEIQMRRRYLYTINFKARIRMLYVNSNRILSIVAAVHIDDAIVFLAFYGFVSLLYCTLCLYYHLILIQSYVSFFAARPLTIAYSYIYTFLHHFGFRFAFFSLVQCA